MKEGRCSLGEKLEKEGQLVELVGNQSPSPEAPPRNERGGSQGDVKRETTAREAMKKRLGGSGSLREKGSEETTQLNTSSPWDQRYLLSPNGCGGG